MSSLHNPDFLLTSQKRGRFGSFGAARRRRMSSSGAPRLSLALDEWKTSTDTEQACSLRIKKLTWSHQNICLRSWGTGRPIDKHIFLNICFGKNQHQVIHGIANHQQKLRHTGLCRGMLSIPDFHVRAPVLLQVI